MKKIFFLIAISSLSAVSCRKDSTTTETTTVDVTTQNSYDDEAIKKFMNDNYFDAKGNIKAFSSTDSSDDNYKKLSDYSPVTLASGVVYIMIPNAQPTTGTAIASNDAISIMQNTNTYVATKDATSGVVSFTSLYPFRNTISGTGSPEFDPSYYYVKKSVLDKYNSDYKTSYTNSYFEIEGFKEALAKFQSFNMSNSDNYNLQGVILVPSRVAFARDAHYNYVGYSLNNRSFVFNFQIYKTTPRSVAGD